MKIISILEQYKFSLVLFAILVLYLFYSYDLQLVNQVFTKLLNINYLIFGLTIFTAYIGSLSFVFPFYSFLKIRRKSTSSVFKDTLKWIYFGIIGKDQYEYISSKFKINKDEFKESIKISDLISIILILVITYPFLKPSNFFLYVLILETLFIIFSVFILKKFISFRLILSSLIRYLFEIFTPFLIFLSYGISLEIQTLLFFTASTSLLYYIPKFKLAGGLLDLYLMIFLSFLGYAAIDGFIIALLFRLMSIFFFVIPMKFISKE